jgi:hypothetical protein
LGNHQLLDFRLALEEGVNVAVFWLVEQPGIARRAALTNFDKPLEAK